MKITMLGSGAWGTALANLLCENGHQVTLWSRSADKAAAMEESRVNPRLHGVHLHPSLDISSSLQAVGESEMVVFATPSFAIAETARLVRDLLPQDAILVSVTKGIEAETGLRMTEILRRETGRAAVGASGTSPPAGGAPRPRPGWGGGRCPRTGPGPGGRRRALRHDRRAGPGPGQAAGCLPGRFV